VLYNENELTSITQNNMNTRIKVTNVELTPSLSEFVNRSLGKVEKIVSKDPAAICDLELSRTTAHHQKGDVYRAEIHVVGGGYDAYAEAEEEDLSYAISEVRDEIVKKLRSGRSKYMNNIRRSGARVKAMLKGFVPWGENGWYRRRR